MVRTMWVCTSIVHMVPILALIYIYAIYIYFYTKILCWLRWKINSFILSYLSMFVSVWMCNSRTTTQSNINSETYKAQNVADQRRRRRRFELLLLVYIYFIMCKTCARTVRGSVVNVTLFILNGKIIIKQNSVCAVLLCAQ